MRRSEMPLLDADEVNPRIDPCSISWSIPKSVEIDPSTAAVHLVSDGRGGQPT